jgi:alanyl aminopeptidase
MRRKVRLTGVHFFVPCFRQSFRSNKRSRDWWIARIQEGNGTLMRQERLPVVLILIALICCAGPFCLLGQADDNGLQPPAFRLPTSVAPLHYSLNLTVVPDKDIFNGTVEIDLNFKEASSVLWLNAEKITIKDATLTVNGQTVTVKVIPQPKDLVGFSFDHPVGPGLAKLHINYGGEISRKDAAGIFQMKDGDNWYVYSQFENISARRAFPCFDEPGYKVPWQVTLNVRRDDGAFSNTPMLSETPGTDGMKTVKFAETKPLPSYLVAFTVGPMDIVEGGHAGANHTPIRILVPRGRAAEAQYVASTTGDIVNLLEQYFGIPYPYEKLDEVALPKVGFAMEHPGLVTYGAGFFLMKTDEATLSRKRNTTSVIAHELAHQWFGDLVTTAWWDDIWLNEGFASWMANKIVNQYHPEWQMNIGELNSYQDAMDTDELVSSRKVRQEILSDDDIENAFDGITYNKGSALLNMFEFYMGSDKFQAGVRAYLTKYSWGNATSADFLQSVGGGDTTLAKAFSSFLDQPGVPLITARLSCKSGSAELQLSQQRFLPRGSKGSADQLWDIPVCVRYPSSDGNASERQCTLVTSKSTSIALKANACPAWTVINADAAGYYRALYDEAMLRSLLKDDKDLTIPERVGLVGDLEALTQGYMPMGEAMALVPKFAHDPHRQVVTKTLAIVGGLDDHLVPEALLSKYQRYISDLYKERAEQLGWKDRQGEEDDSRLLRPAVVGVVANHTGDPVFIDQANKLALAWLDDHKAVDPDMLDVVLNTAARHGNRALFDRMRAQAKKETQEDVRRTVLRALGSFRDPAILKAALAIVLTDEFDNRESVGILFAARDFSETRDLDYDFVKQNWDALIAKLPTDYGAFLPFVADGYCNESHRADAEAFFTGRATKYAGGPRNLAQVLEGISLCSANKDANEPGVIEFLEKY